MKHFWILSAILLLLGCGPDDSAPDFDQDDILGYKPVYADSADLIIAVTEAQDITLAGKIYSYGDLLLVNEVGKGVHFYDYSDPLKPVNKLFLQVPGSHDMAMKSGVLYIDHFNDLLAVKVYEDTAVVWKRIPDVMGFSDEYPPANDAYFECVDDTKGVVVGWELSELSNPQCYRP